MSDRTRHQRAEAKRSRRRHRQQQGRRGRGALRASPPGERAKGLARIIAVVRDREERLRDDRADRQLARRASASPDRLNEVREEDA